MLKKIITPLLIIIFCAIVLSLSIRGIAGNPNDQNLDEVFWTDEGPLELSPERGKFALTYSIVEDNSVHFSVPVARFATPDLGFHNGEYVSLFPPGVSYITMPGYIIGRSLGASQVGTYSVIALFALLNVLLIWAILKNLKVNNLISTICAMTFLFGTTAFAYAASLYQHHLSTFIILTSVYLLIRFKTLWSLLVIWFLLAASLVIDSPNAFLMFPIGIYALGRVIYFRVAEEKIKVVLNVFASLTVVSALVPLLFFGWFNREAYGNPFQLGGTVATVKALDDQGNPTTPEDAGTENLEHYVDPNKQDKQAVNFFLTRNLLNGFYIHFFSPDRGMFYFTPVMFLAMVGVFYFYKRNKSLTALFLGLIGTNVVLYSMWGDPWGGWAYGSRYLIPSYAILSIFLGFALLHLNRYLLFTALFFALFTYSVAVNTVGAITSNHNPPEVEVLGLEELSGVEQKYTYFRNFDMLDVNKSKSFVFNSIAYKSLTAWQYYFVLIGLIILPASGLLIADKFLKGKSK